MDWPTSPWPSTCSPSRSYLRVRVKGEWCQVHEKSILMPALAVTLLMLQEQSLVQSFHQVATFSMFPLLEKDGLSLQYCALMLLFLCLPLRVSSKKTAMLTTGCIVLHLLRLLIPPPTRLPFLHDLLFSGFSFLFFLSSFLYLNYRQWNSEERLSALVSPYGRKERHTKKQSRSSQGRL